MAADVRSMYHGWVVTCCYGDFSQGEKDERALFLFCRKFMQELVQNTPAKRRNQGVIIKNTIPSPPNLIPLISDLSHHLPHLLAPSTRHASARYRHSPSSLLSAHTVPHEAPLPTNSLIHPNKHIKHQPSCRLSETPSNE